MFIRCEAGGSAVSVVDGKRLSPWDGRRLSPWFNRMHVTCVMNVVPVNSGGHLLGAGPEDDDRENGLECALGTCRDVRGQRRPVPAFI